MVSSVRSVVGLCLLCELALELPLSSRMGLSCSAVIGQLHVLRRQDSLEVILVVVLSRGGSNSL